MSAGASPIGAPARPTILVMAVPYVLSTALASRLRTLYNVVAPNLDAGETAPVTRWDAVLTLASLATQNDVSRLVIVLPNTSFDEPVLVRVEDRTIRVYVTGPHPMDVVVELLQHHLSSPI